MPELAFTLHENVNATYNSAAYDLWRTDDAPVQGCVFTDLRQYYVSVDGRPEPRPRVQFQFFGLTVDGHPIGNPRCDVLFRPSWTGQPATVPFVSLHEPGLLDVHLGQRITAVGERAARLVTDLLVAVTGEFLTDERVARTRFRIAEEYRAEADRVHQDATNRERLAQHHAQAARVTAEAAYALLTSMCQQR